MIRSRAVTASSFVADEWKKFYDRELVGFGLVKGGDLAIGEGSESPRARDRGCILCVSREVKRQSWRIV